MSVERRAAAIVLVLEAIVVFFFVLAVFGLRLVDRQWALGCGFGMIVVLLAAAGSARTRVGYALGWVAQLALVALGVLHPAMFTIGALFAAMWVYAVVSGRRADRQRDASGPIRQEG